MIRRTHALLAMSLGWAVTNCSDATGGDGANGLPGTQGERGPEGPQGPAGPDDGGVVEGGAEDFFGRAVVGGGVEGADAVFEGLLYEAGGV